MSETKFTPGPWLTDQTLVYTLTPVRAADGTQEFYRGQPVVENAWTAHVTRNKHNIEWAELVANTHLIAAAPDLYEALYKADWLLRAICGPGGNYPDEREIMAKVRAALAKARGET